MKKSLIALAVAGAMTAPMIAQADATLYGSLRAGLAMQDGADADIRDEASRIGVKGTVDLGLENTKGLFTFEQAISTETGAWGGGRLAYLGMTGDWGTGLVGRQYHPYYTMVNSHTNVFQSADGAFGEAFALGNAQHKRVSNTLAYASPVMSGFQVVAGAVVAGDGSDDNDNFDSEVDGYNIGAQYTGIEGLRVSASFGNVDADIATAASVSTKADATFGTITPASVTAFESDIWGLGASYKMGDFTVSGKYEERDDTYNVVGGVKADIDWAVWELAAVYQMGNTALKARYGNIEAKANAAYKGVEAAGKEDGDQWGVEVEHKLGKRGVMWVGYTNFDEEAAALSALQASVTATTAVAEDTLVIGYRLDF